MASLWTYTGIMLLTVVVLVAAQCEKLEIEESFHNPQCVGMYEKMSSSCNSKPVYKHHTANMYVYYMSGYWLVHNMNCDQNGVQEALARAQSTASYPEYVPENSWEEKKSNEWTKMYEFEVSCFDNDYYDNNPDDPDNDDPYDDDPYDDDDDGHDDDDLSAGAIAGICIGVIAVVALIILIVVLCMKNKDKKAKSSEARPPPFMFPVAATSPSTGGNVPLGQMAVPAGYPQSLPNNPYYIPSPQAVSTGKQNPYFVQATPGGAMSVQNPYTVHPPPDGAVGHQMAPHSFMLQNYPALSVGGTTGASMDGPPTYEDVTILKEPHRNT